MTTASQPVALSARPEPQAWTAVPSLRHNRGMAATRAHLDGSDLRVLDEVLRARAKTDPWVRRVREHADAARRRREELKALRKQLGLSQRAAARACGIAQSTLSDAENGRKDHHLSTVEKWETGLRALAEQRSVVAGNCWSGLEAGAR